MRKRVKTPQRCTESNLMPFQATEANKTSGVKLKNSAVHNYRDWQLEEKFTVTASSVQLNYKHATTHTKISNIRET